MLGTFAITKIPEEQQFFVSLRIKKNVNIKLTIGKNVLSKFKTKYHRKSWDGTQFGFTTVKYDAVGRSICVGSFSLHFA